ncbi:hypothetical protein COLINT_03411 [Collinsella intestinalis DSM 13280]|uniref:Uncharacterized protein n=1 Tax=Collinsella intestinalis DSM 13280 TaxID=521003 RepID=C4FBF8_9ACTN|nr:hypothetical protein COLINT_03411 [Collinsella intestinalis DSM 13280]
MGHSFFVRHPSMNGHPSAQAGKRPFTRLLTFFRDGIKDHTSFPGIRFIILKYPGIYWFLLVLELPLKLYT